MFSLYHSYFISIWNFDGSSCSYLFYKVNAIEGFPKLKRSVEVSFFIKLQAEHLFMEHLRVTSFICAICYCLYNLRNMKNTHGDELFLESFTNLSPVK